MHKPANILFTSEGAVRIMDFGIAHAVGSAPVTATGMVMGTPGYLAPERVAGAQAGPASDLYALGIVAFECLAGARPFSARRWRWRSRTGTARCRRWTCTGGAA